MPRRWALGWAIGCALASASPAGAATFTVTTTADSGMGSLREAVTAANATSDADRIVFALPAGPKTVTLASQLPIVSGTLVIDGSSEPDLLIDGGGNAPFLRATLLSVTTLENVGYQNGSISLDGFSAFTFDESGTSAISGNFQGSPVLVTKTGPGTTQFIGNAFIAPTGTEGRVEEGTLEVLGDALVAFDTFVVRSGGTLAGDVNPGNSGFGSQGDGIRVLGRVAPSGPSGFLRFVGGTTATFEDGSVLEIDMAPGTVGDQLEVIGPVVVEDGARLRLIADPTAFGPMDSATATALMSLDSITGSFDVSNFAFLDRDYVQNNNSITVTLTANGETLSTLAQTPNQRSVASTLTALEPGATGDLLEVFDAIDLAENANEVRGLLDAVGGEALGAFATARQMLGERTARALARRVRDPAWGQGRAIYAGSLDLPLPQLAASSPLSGGFRADTSGIAPARGPDFGAPPSRRLRAGGWIDAFGQLGQIDGDFGQGEVDTELLGGTLGLDVWLADRVLIGVAAGYAHSEIEVDDRDADLRGDTIQGALYAGYSSSRGYLSGYGRYAYTLQDSVRRIRTGQLRRNADADWSAQDIGAGAEGGVTLASYGRFALQPIAGIDWLSLSEEDYRESGAGSLNLAVDPEDLDALSARIGARIFGRIQMDGPSELVPELRAFWQRELGDQERSLRARLLGAGSGGAIRVEGAEIPDQALILGAGWSASVGRNLRVLLDYDALLDSDRSEHQGTLSIRARFESTPF